MFYILLLIVYHQGRLLIPAVLMNISKFCVRSFWLVYGEKLVHTPAHISCSWVVFLLPCYLLIHNWKASVIWFSDWKFKHCNWMLLLARGHWCSWKLMVLSWKRKNNENTLSYIEEVFFISCLIVPVFLKGTTKKFQVWI